ncbi:MAG: FMN-binding protein [Clostridia bacterium]|nr:FMN-binding protein [Clostridia bacterium]
MKRVPASITLMLVSLVAAVLLALTNSVTRDPIRLAALSEANSARKTVLPLAEEYEPVETPTEVDSLYEGRVGDQVVGHTATVTVQGFAGPVEVTVGMDMSGVLTGLSVGGSAFAETAGLGDLAKSPSFTDQFVGKAVPVTLGDGIDAISGATITSRAVVGGVNMAAQAIRPAVEMTAGTEADTVSAASATVNAEQAGREETAGDVLE